MVDSKRAGDALALRPFPGLDSPVLARLHPRDRLPGRVTRCGQRNRPQRAIREAPRDAVDAAARLCLEHAFEQRAKRGGIDETPRPRQARVASRQQTSTPSRRARRQIAQIDAKHILDTEAAPDVDEVLEFPGKRFLMRGEIRRVDSAGRHSGHDIRSQVGKHARQVAEHSHLVRGTRTAAGEYEGQIGSLVRNTYSLRRKSLSPQKMMSRVLVNRWAGSSRGIARRLTPAVVLETVGQMRTPDTLL